MTNTRAWAEIDLDALSRNLDYLRRCVGPRTKLMLVAKADAYGHGAVGIAHHALRSGVAAIGVSSCDEALELRRAGIGARLLVLGLSAGDEAARALAEDIEIGVPSMELLREVAQTAHRLGLAARVHVAVDSGMHRLGLSPAEVTPVLETVRSSRALELAGVMTHVAATDGALSDSTAEQLRVFQGVLEEARARDLLAGEDVWIHAANSACVLSRMDPLFDAVRPGIAAYGVPPDARLVTPELTPVLSVRTRIVHLTALAEGERVGYGGTWTARRPSLIATLPVGYDDGVDRRLSNRGHVLVRGRRAPMVGQISMDYTTIDVTDVPQVARGDTVTLIGADGERRIRVEDVAREIGTIAYELLCSIGKRVDRHHVSGRSPRGSPD